jgi:hypothetical protein
VVKVTEMRQGSGRVNVLPAKHNRKPVRPEASDIGRITDTIATWALLKMPVAIAREIARTLSSPVLRTGFKYAPPRLQLLQETNRLKNRNQCLSREHSETISIPTI